MPWLSFHNIQLTVEDRDILGNGECLNDKHINFAQEILKQKFPNIYGLRSTLLHKTELQSVPSCSSFLQIIHSRNCHWIVASTIGCQSTDDIMVHMIHCIITSIHRHWV